MSARTARWIFYLGTLISLVLFLGLTVDTHRQVRALTNADKLTSRVVAGKRVWHKYNCNDCHTILGFGSYYGPDLTKAVWRRGIEGVKAVVRNPEKFTTWRKMPHHPVSAGELDDLAAFLEWTAAIDTHDWPPQDRSIRAVAARGMALGVGPGAALFQAKGCFDCHRLGQAGSDLGPDLSTVGSRLSFETINAFLENPEKVKPGTVMPPPDLTAGERDSLARYLAGLK